MTLQQQLGKPAHIPGFGLRQAKLADVLEDLLLLQFGHGLWVGPGREQGRGHLVHFFVGALGAEQHRNQQGEWITVVQGHRCFRIAFVEPLQHHLRPFLLAHGPKRWFPGNDARCEEVLLFRCL